MIDIYKKQVCINCKTDKCTNKIKIIKQQDIFDNEIVTTTIVKCDEFNCKNKREKQSLNWSSAYDRV